MTRISITVFFSNSLITLMHIILPCFGPLGRMQSNSKLAYIRDLIWSWISALSDNGWDIGVDPTSDHSSDWRRAGMIVRSFFSHMCKYKIKTCLLSFSLSVELSWVFHQYTMILSVIYCIMQHDLSRAIQSVLFVSAINTLLQTFFGARLPVVMGNSFYFLPMVLSIVTRRGIIDYPDPHEVRV